MKERQISRLRKETDLWAGGLWRDRPLDWGMDKLLD